MVPIVSALKYIRQFCPSYAQCWVAVDDLAELIPLFFNLDRRKATYFKDEFINKSLSANKAVRNALDLPQNDIGTYKKNYCAGQDGKKAWQKFIYLCPDGILPHEPDNKWYSDMKLFENLKLEKMHLIVVGKDENTLIPVQAALLLEINKMIDKKDKHDRDKAGKAAKKKKKTNAKGGPTKKARLTVLEKKLVDELLNELFADEGDGVVTKERTYNKIEVKCMIRKVLAMKLVLPSVVAAGGNNKTQENVGGSVLNYQPTTGDDTLEMPEETEEHGQYYSNRSVTVPVGNGEKMTIDNLP